MPKQENQQQTIFDYQPPVEILDFNGDFIKQMDFISKLPEKDWGRLFGIEGEEK